jgi:hypothetical protein
MNAEAETRLQKFGAAIEKTALTVVAVVVGGAVCVIVLSIGAMLLFPQRFEISRTRHNELVAAHEINRIIKAERKYSTLFPTAGFTCNLKELANTRSAPDADILLDRVIAEGKKSGYQFNLASCRNADTFTVTAIPDVPGKTGEVAFCASQDGKIRYSKMGALDDCIRNGLSWNKPDPFNW